MWNMQRQINNGKPRSTSAKQDWSVGNEVKVGFLTLRVLGWNAGHGHWNLESLDKTKQYEFIPHNGLSRIA